MIYKIGMLCKHFKGKNLLEKNIYRIEQIGVEGQNVDQDKITYTGDNSLVTAKNLIVYSNIFQDNKLFCREYEDISQNLSKEKQIEFNQEIRVQPLTEEEQELINQQTYIERKKQYIKNKY
jgi:hypothetical protein